MKSFHSKAVNDTYLAILELLINNPSILSNFEPASNKR